MSFQVLVTGGAGFIGSHLVDALLTRGHRVRVLDSLIGQVHGASGGAHLNSAAEFIEGDVADPAAVRDALDGVQVVFHLAAEVGVGQSMYEMARYVRANTYGTSILLEATVERRKEIVKVVVASSMSIYGEGAYDCRICGRIHPGLRQSTDLAKRRWSLHCPTCQSELKPAPTPEDKTLMPTSVYAVSKQDQEQLCLIVGRAYNIPTVALRYFNVYGHRQALSNPYTGVCAIFSARLLNNERPLIFEDGGQARDFVHVSDIVQANLLALESSKADFLPVNVGTGVATPISSIARVLAKGLGKNLEPEFINKYREGDIRHCVADITRARTLLGYEPKVHLEDGLAELLAWVRQQRAEDKVEQASSELVERELVR